MKKIITFVFMLSAMWTTNSLAQFRDRITNHILQDLVESDLAVVDYEGSINKINALDEAQLRFIIQDAINKSVQDVLKSINKSDLALFLKEAGLLSPDKYSEYFKLFSRHSRSAQTLVNKASEHLLSFLTSENSEKMMVQLNLQTSDAIRQVYNTGQLERSLENRFIYLMKIEFEPSDISRIRKIMTEPNAGRIFAEQANRYLDSTTGNLYSQSSDLLTRTSARIGRKFFKNADQVLDALKKIF